MFESEFKRKEFISEADGTSDWYLVHAGQTNAPCIVILHGHGSSGDQILVRPDKAKLWTAFLLERGFHVIAPNYRGNSWMSEAAQADLLQILNVEKPQLQWSKLLIVSSSMGASGALIFAVRHPEAVDGIGVLGAMTDPVSYLQWLKESLSPLLQEIRRAILGAFPTGEEQKRNSALRQAEKLLVMPVRYWHGEADQIIPFSQAQALCEKLKTAPNFKFRSIPGGDHDSPIPFFRQAIEELLQSLSSPHRQAVSAE